MPSYKLYHTTPDATTGSSLDGISVSGTSTYYSEPWGGDAGSTFGLHLEWTSTSALIGVWTIWRSDKEAPDRTSDTDWVQDTTFTPTNPASSSGKFAVNGTDSATKFWRLKYVNTSGTGSIRAYATPARLR